MRLISDLLIFFFTNFFYLNLFLSNKIYSHDAIFFFIFVLPKFVERRKRNILSEGKKAHAQQNENKIIFGLSLSFKLLAYEDHDINAFIFGNISFEL